MTRETVEDRQGRYLATLRATGSHVRARAAAGIGARTVGKWREQSETFAEAEVEAAELALDDIVQASRTSALAGDSAQLTNWMRIRHSELRPSSSVSLGVKVGATSRVETMSDEELRTRVQQILDDALRRGMSGDFIDVEARALPAPVRPEDLL